MTASTVEPRDDVGHADAVLVQQLRDAVEKFIADNAMPHEVFAARAGLKSRQHLEQFLANARRPGYRLEMPTAEKLAAAIGHELTLAPKATPEGLEKSK